MSGYLVTASSTNLDLIIHGTPRGAASLYCHVGQKQVAAVAVSPTEHEQQGVSKASAQDLSKCLEKSSKIAIKTHTWKSCERRGCNHFVLETCCSA
jgi:hypothetical protein